MTDETLRWRGGWARLGSWRGRADVAYLSVGADHPPTPEIVDRCLRLLRGRGYSAVVTSALAAADALPFLDAGFSVRERLHLLAHAMGDLPQPGRATRRARKGDRAEVLELDHRSFDGFWRLDGDGLTNAIDATPSSRFRVVDGDDGLVAYAVTGRAGQHGYLQRLAVDPGARREGLGRTIVLDGLRWLRRHGATQALVNTQCDNAPALALYESCGFRELPTGLCVMGRSL
ncbi:MAG TPA: GNAT family N-acetyltransferase [Acidimicrobiia bacterium]|jgi:ribosomal protein S18 acetylase RimI-like enzyme